MTHAAKSVFWLPLLLAAMSIRSMYIQKELTKITLEDVAYARSARLCHQTDRRGKTDPESERIECLVAPAFVNGESQLANIDDVFNGVLVRGNATGDVVFYGEGAGKLPTASAVVADVIHEAKVFGDQHIPYMERQFGKLCVAL